MSTFVIEVIADNSGKWVGNAMKYETFEEAREEAIDLAMRWLLVRQARVVEYLEGEVVNTTVVFGE